MKKFRILSVLIALVIFAMPALGRQPLSRAFEGVKGVSCVYISKAAMSLGLNMAAQADESISGITDCIKNPEGLEVITAEKASTVDRVKKFAEEQISKLNMESFLSAADGEEITNIYVGAVDGNVMKDILITTSSPKEYTLVYIMGEIDPVKLSKLNDNK